MAEQAPAPLEHILPGGIEVAGVPGVGHIAGAAGEVHQLVYLPFGVAAAQGQHVSDVPRVHADEQVEAGIVGLKHLACALARAGDAVLREFPARGRVHLVAQLLGRSGGRLDVEAGGQALLRHKGLHDKLGHRAAADVAVADEKQANGFHAKKVG